MLSSPTPPAGSRGLAAATLRSAGLMEKDKDTRMRDLTDKPGRKTLQRPAHKTRSHQSRAIDAIVGKDRSAASTSRNSMAAARAAVANEGLAIRGASSSKIPTGSVARLRRNATSSTTPISARLGGVVAPKLVELWRTFVRARYNPEARFLNLENMLADEFIKKHNLVPPGAPSASQKEAAVIFKLAKELKPEVETVSLARNGLASGVHLNAIPHYLPKLKNLSLEGNSLRFWRDMDLIAGRNGKLEQLRELILTGNPIRELEYQNNRVDKYKSEMSRRFPTLEILDGEPVAKIAFDAPHGSSAVASSSKLPAATSFPFDMSGPFVTGVDGGVISKFLMQFFPLFDNQRSALIDIYHPSATFSFSANTAIPPRARVEGFHSSKEMPHQRKLEWPPWLTGGQGGSRNLSKMKGGLERMAKTLHIGSAEAVKAMADLPSTEHDIVGTPDKFCIDAWPITTVDGSMNLFLTVHGQFTELPSRGIRSFDRSFILTPAPEGSRAKQLGWDVMVLSDQLCVRAYSSHEAWRPGPMKIMTGDKSPRSGTPNVDPNPMNAWLATLPPPAAARIKEESTPIPEPQRTLVLQVCQRTGLNVRFSVDCLQGNEWDFERALANFEQVKDLS
ncbi:nuclear mRNA export, poly(A)+RNA binding protein [Steccherinum ochraceum]|uniref:Nuclear mRNA export, poly(A)+RNA binding protein n=1 Tax=Steccherinum ochraceum TaxID=92696 RepID=A0A4R0RSM9_9APHY|nr:nuclear mRNA export, poly(A)+RNA binding protein [Steccherinum ochraceum]